MGIRLLNTMTPYQIAIRNAEATRRLLAKKTERTYWKRSDAFEWTQPNYKCYTPEFKLSQRSKFFKTK